MPDPSVSRGDATGQPSEVRSGLDEFGRWHDARGRIVVGWINPETDGLMRLPNGHRPYDYEPAWEVVYGS